MKARPPLAAPSETIRRVPMKRILLSAFCATALLLAACQSTTTKDAGAPVEERTPSTAAPGTTTSGATGAGVSGTATGASGAAALRDPNSPLSKRIIYFDYDSYVVKDEYKPLIEAHGRYLQTNRNARMTVQGNTDERGSREYNIALGQRRADAVKRMMMVYGATEVQIETVSFGKEKPRREGHDESSWAENRRDEIVYVGE
jgi:peptidoglycan-associated lipoprotein